MRIGSNSITSDNGGPLSLSVGNSQGATIDENGTLNAEKLTEQDVGMFGVGQEWQNKLSERSLNVTYTNTESQPIAVAAYYTNSVNAARNMIFFVDDLLIDIAGSSYGGQSSGNIIIVPVGSTYRITSNNGIAGWTELRTPTT